MLRLLRRMAVPVAAVAAMGITSVVAKADSVAFHTVVTFTSAPTGVTLTSPTEVTFSNGDTLSTQNQAYGGTTGNPDVPFGPLPTNVSFGALSSTNSGAGIASFSGGLGIEIDIYQDYTTPPTTPPGPGTTVGPGTFVGSASGQIFPLLNSFSGGTIHFTSPLSFVLPNGATGFPPGVVYTVGQDQQITFSSNGLFDISGNVSELPLPATASTGLALLGGLGLLTGVSVLRRRRQMA